MKKIFIVLVMICLFSIPVTAGAGVVGTFFDNGVPYMDSSMWMNISDPDGPPGVTSAMTDTNGRLEWTVSPSWTSPDEAWEGYASKWVLDLSSDFNVSVDFNYAPGSLSNHAGIYMGFYYFDGPINPASEPFYTGISAEHWDDGGTLQNEYGTEFVFGDTDIFNNWSRSATNDTLYASYSTATDTLTLAAGSGNSVYLGLSGYTSYLGVSLEGWSGGTALASGDAYFQNLQVSGDIGPPPVVPEPISSTLFLIGAATLGFRRFRKTKVQ